jgi:hypothetical protein
MRTRKKELDVDFIGGVEPLTKEEEKRISEAIKKLKAKQSSSRRPTRKLTTQEKSDNIAALLPTKMLILYHLGILLSLCSFCFFS